MSHCLDGFLVDNLAQFSCVYDRYLLQRWHVQREWYFLQGPKRR